MENKEETKVEPIKTINIYDGLLQVQSGVVRVKMESTNPHFKSSYADLESVMTTIREALIKAGIVVIQTPKAEGNQLAGCLTELRHVESGTSISNELLLPVGGKGDVHAIGSCITYARRYSLMSMIGLVPSQDDDGNASAGANTAPKIEPKKQAHPVVMDRPAPVNPNIPPAGDPVTYRLKTPTKQLEMTKFEDDEIPDFKTPEDQIKQTFEVAQEIRINFRYDCANLPEDKLGQVVDYCEVMSKKGHVYHDFKTGIVEAEIELPKLKRYLITA